MRRNREARDARDREAAQALADQLDAPPIQVPARAGEGGKLFGSVTAADIAAAVQAQTGVESTAARSRSTSRSRSSAPPTWRYACTPTCRDTVTRRGRRRAERVRTRRSDIARMARAVAAAAGRLRVVRPPSVRGPGRSHLG